MRILVTGGTGVVGSACVRLLLERGHSVRLFTRKATTEVAQFEGEIEPWNGNVDDQVQVLEAVEGCDTVLHLAAIVSEEPPEVTFQKVNVEGTRYLVRASESHNVQRFIYCSSLGADTGRSGYHQSKREAEEIVQTFSRDWLILRPGAVYGNGDEIVSLLLQMVRTLPAIPVIDGGDIPSQPIWAEDFAQAVVQAVEDSRLNQRILECAGTETITMNQILDEFGRLTGKEPLRLPLPGWLAQMGTEALQTAGVKVPFSASQIEMLSEGNRIPAGHANAMTEVFHVPMTPLSQGLKRLLDDQPAQLPKQGGGSLSESVYVGIIGGTGGTAADLFSLFMSEIATLFPDAVRVDPEGRGTKMGLGEVLTLELPLRGTVQVRVIELSDTRATCVSLAGHPLSGTVTFEAADRNDGIRFSVITCEKPSTLPDAVTMALGGRAAQKANWITFIQNVAERTGGSMVAPIVTTTRSISGDEQKQIEEDLERKVLTFRRDGHGQASVQ